jgi:TRAP-type mannitol/chloroaromatic compound transport system permease small subunit
MGITRVLDLINETVGRIVAVIAVVFAAIIIYDVVMRYVFNDPTRWAFDVTKQLYGFYFVMLGGYALKHRSHVSVDLVTENLSPGVLRIVEAAGYIIFFFPFAWVFFTRSWEFATRSLAQAETTYGAVQLPVYPLKISMCVAAGLLLIQGVSEFIKILFGYREPAQ